MIAGAVAEKYLKTACSPAVEIVAFVSSVGSMKLTEPQIRTFVGTVTRTEVDKSAIRCPDLKLAGKMETFIADLKKRGDSVGGIVTCVVRNCPLGLGEPCFDKLEAKLAHAMLSIPATKGFQIGSGFAGTELQGSQHNDDYFLDADLGSIRTRTNNSGGIQGGISNGEPIVFQVAFKPPATISLAQNSVNRRGEEKILEAKGRHDPCIVNRALPIVETMTALVLMDAFLIQQARHGAQTALLKHQPSLAAFGAWPAGVAGAAQEEATVFGGAAVEDHAPMGEQSAKGRSKSAKSPPRSRAASKEQKEQAIVVQPATDGIVPSSTQQTGGIVPPTKYLHPVHYGRWQLFVAKLAKSKPNTMIIVDSML